MTTPIINDQPRPTSNIGSSLSGSENTKFIDKNPPQIILGTALVHALDKFGQTLLCRELLDSGSQLHFMTESCATQLGLERSRTDLPISGIGNSTSTIRHIVTTTLHSLFSTFSATIDFHVLPQITGSHPDTFINVNEWNILKELDLADPRFYQSNKIGILIGAELLFVLLRQEQYRLSSDLPILQNTQLGWVVSGKLQSALQSHPHCNIATTALPRLSSLEKTLQKFWELEDYKTPSKALTEEEE